MNFDVAAQPEFLELNYPLAMAEAGQPASHRGFGPAGNVGTNNNITSRQYAAGPQLRQCFHVGISHHVKYNINWPAILLLSPVQTWL